MKLFRIRGMILATSCIFHQIRSKVMSHISSTQLVVGCVPHGPHFLFSSKSDTLRFSSVKDNHTEKEAINSIYCHPVLGEKFPGGCNLYQWFCSLRRGGIACSYLRDSLNANVFSDSLREYLHPPHCTLSSTVRSINILEVYRITIRINHAHELNCSRL